MSNPETEMRIEYDFSNARRGGHYREYRGGDNVRVFEDDGSAEVRHFTLSEGAACRSKNSNGVSSTTPLAPGRVDFRPRRRAGEIA